MKARILFTVLFCLAVRPAQAQDAPHTTMQPICFQLQNTAPYTVFGSLVSNIYTAPDGTTARHHTNFRLESRHFAQFCSTGPFYPGDKLDLQLRSLFPLFECRTGTSGPITIHGEEHEDGTTKTWADCL